jgi:thioredoxin 1
MKRHTEGPVAVTNATFDQTVLAAPRPVLVDFGAEWRGPCVAVAPVIRSLALEYGDRLTVATVDVDTDPQLATRYGVRSLPTVILLEGGEIRRVLVGPRSGQDYRKAIDGVLH